MYYEVPGITDFFPEYGPTTGLTTVYLRTTKVIELAAPSDNRHITANTTSITHYRQYN